MKSLLIILLFLFAGIISIAQSDDIEYVRFLYFEDWIGECGAENLMNYFDAIDIEDNALLMSYKGAALATTANCKFFPWQKLNIFNKGKDYIEMAVQFEPQNLEIRFVRFTIQSNIPAILNYDNLEEDKDFILKKLNLQTSLVLNKKMVNRIYYYLKNSDELSSKEKNNLEIIIAKG